MIFFSFITNWIKFHLYVVLVVQQKVFWLQITVADGMAERGKSFRQKDKKIQETIDIVISGEFHAFAMFLLSSWSGWG